MPCGNGWLPVHWRFPIHGKSRFRQRTVFPKKKNGLIFEQVNPNDKNFVLSYGIADNLEQIKSYYSDLIANDNHKYIISFTQINSQEEYDNLLLDLSPYINYIGLNKQIKKFKKPILTFKLHILKEKQFKTMYQKNIFIS